MRKPRILSLAEMTPIAREAMYNALKGYLPPSEEQREQLALGRGFTDTDGIFEIYIPADRPRDATVISRVTINRATGEVTVEVFLEPKSQSLEGS